MRGHHGHRHVIRVTIKWIIASPENRFGTNNSANGEHATICDGGGKSARRPHWRRARAAPSWSKSMGFSYSSVLIFAALERASQQSIFVKRMRNHIKHFKFKWKMYNECQFYVLAKNRLEIKLYTPVRFSSGKAVSGSRSFMHLRCVRSAVLRGEPYNDRCFAGTNPAWFEMMCLDQWQTNRAWLDTREICDRGLIFWSTFDSFVNTLDSDTHRLEKFLI